MSLVLVGYRGSGKTTVGRLLAKRQRLQLVDTDELIVRSAGMNIREIFARHGEQYFRQLESDALQAALALPDAAISTGGGIVLREENRAALSASRRPVIYLHADARTLHGRIAGDANSQANRPNLTALGDLAEVEHLLEIRDPLYREVAQLVIEVAQLSPEQIADEILRGCERLEHHG